jgi:hypothetical protein
MDSEAGMKILEGLLVSLGKSEFWHLIKKLRARKLDVADRSKQKAYKWSEYTLLYHHQRGICGICGHDMPLIRRKIEMDHKNVNLTGDEYEARSNRQVVHMKCNREKAAKSIPEQAKFYGRPMTELV